MALHLTIKAICRRIEDRYGSGKSAAAAAGVSPGVWSTYCSDSHPDVTIPLHRIPYVANASERAAFAALILGDDFPPTGGSNLREEACEATEAAASVQRAARDLGENPTPLRARAFRDAAAGALIEVMDVVRAAPGAAPHLRAVS